MAFRASTVAWLSHRHRNRKDSARIDWRELVDQILSDCHKKQRWFVEDDSIRVCALVARGGGKTTAMRARFVIRMLKTNRARCCFVATSRLQAEEFMWAPLKELCESLGIAATFNESKLKCTFLHNGSTLRLVGADDKKSVDKLRGQPFHEVGIDESASYSDSLFDNMLNRIIIPRLGDFNGTLCCFGTPGKTLRGEFYEMTRSNGDDSRLYESRELEEFAGWEKWSRHHWTMEDGAAEKQVMRNLWSAANRNKRAKGWSDDNPVWRREYLGEWAADDTENIYKYSIYDEDGNLFNRWEPEIDRNGFAILPEEFSDWRYSYGQDMGHSDPYALQVLAWSPSDTSKKLYHIYEFSAKKMYARKIACLLVGEDPEDGSKWPNLENPEGCIGVTGWPDSIVADTAGMGGGVLDELKEVYGVRTIPADKKNKHDNIELTNGDLVDGRLVVIGGSELEKQLLDLQWVINEYGQLREDKAARNDCTDALIYARREASHLMNSERVEDSRHFQQGTDLEAVPDADSADSGSFDDTYSMDDSNYSDHQW